jgi:hypothetical protein
VLLEKLIVFEAVKNFCPLCGAPRSVIVFTRSYKNMPEADILYDRLGIHCGVSLCPRTTPKLEHHPQMFMQRIHNHPPYPEPSSSILALIMG